MFSNIPHSRSAMEKGGTIRMPIAKQLDSDMSEYCFSKFASTYFNSGVTNQYSKRPLKRALLDHPLPMDEISAQAIWVMILRFMGDMAETKCDENENEEEDSIMQRLALNFARTQVQTRHEAVDSRCETDHQRLIHRTLKRKTKLPAVLRNALNNSDEIEYYHMTLGTERSNLEKLHFIIGHAILRPELRDEILCQICKQLTNNPCQTSFSKGWILLSLCLGCFPPSQKFEKYLRCFIRGGPKLYASFCEQRLDRTLKNGARTQPPSYLELQANRNKAPITLNVFLMDGNKTKLQIDSSSTAKEAVDQLVEHVGLIDIFGFSIVISLFDKVMSLGNGREHIMDAVSNCEQYAKEQGQDERKAPWKLYLRKEIFTPWYNPSTDHLATHLIYKQVTRGVNFGEYRCKSEKDIAMLCALEYYAEYGAPIDSKILHKLIPEFVPKDLLVSGEKATKIWERLIIDAFDRCEYPKKNLSPVSAKEDIAIFAHLTWPMMFSRFFEAVRVTGPKLLSDNLVIAVNSLGVFLIDETEQVLAEFPYPEILSVLSEVDEDSHNDELRINTVQREDFSFKCFESNDASELINFMLNNLRVRSRYAVAVQDYKPSSEVQGHLTLAKGDLVVFDKDNKGTTIFDTENRWSRGECNGQKGFFPTDMVIVLATLTKPSKKTLLVFKENCAEGKKTAIASYDTVQRKKMHTLMKFAEEHFQLNSSSARQSQIIFTARSSAEELWKHNRDPIKAPLLKKIQGDPVLFKQSVLMFSLILKYMGDIPRGKNPVNTDLIFRPAIENENIRDELFCQIMKQLTDNRVLQSEKRGWDLMWLATGIIYPGPIVMKELSKFLKTRTHHLSGDCIRRLRKTLLNGQRKQPPYILEIEAIQNRCMQIYHKIYFPDNSVEDFEIQSSTRASELCDAIGKRLKLKSWDGFSMFVKITEKVFSIPKCEFVFDFITKSVLWAKQNMLTRSSEQQIQHHYQLYFMKKLWLDTVLGDDLNADHIFYYSQEVPKYLNGYYKVSIDLGSRIAAILYRVQFGRNMIPLQRIHHVLTKLLPEDLISVQKSGYWKSSIVEALNKLGTLDETQGKRMFLEEVSKFPMFGSTFFLVKQTNDQSLPETILIAINRHGFHIIDPRSKDILQKYDFTELNFWSSGNTFFHVRFGNMIGASKLLCSTTQGYKMDDLLSSYIKYYHED